MKKKIIIISTFFIVVIVSGLVYYLDKSTTKEQVQESSFPSKPSDYCLITYEVSSDDGKTWHEAIISSGQKPIYKAQCWKKYIHILDGFKASTDTDGRWHSKIKDGKIISHPSLHFSDTPFEQKNKNSKQEL